MATQALVAQSIIFVSPTNSFDETAILANSLVQSLAQNSAGNDLIMSYQSFQNWNGTVWTNHQFLELKCFVSTTFQTTIQQNIPALQTAFPQYSIYTWGYAVTFGN